MPQSDGLGGLVDFVFDYKMPQLETPLFYFLLVTFGFGKVTNSALSSTITYMRIQVSSWAVCFGSINASNFSPLYILNMSDGFQVIWVDTSSVPA